MNALRLAVIAVAATLMPIVLPDYQVTLMNYVGLASLVALGLVLLTGFGGLTSFGQATFVGFGAYTSAYLTTTAGVSPWLTLLAGLAVSGGVALVIGLVTLRLSGHYLPLSTIAWSLSLYFLAGNQEMLGGHNGITGVPPVTLLGAELSDARSFSPLIWTCVLLGLLVVHNLLHSRTGRAIRCLRGRSPMMEAFGIDAGRVKIQIFVIAALLASVSGWLYVHLLRFVNPTPFGINASIEYLFMTVVGGAGHIWGAVVGAGALILIRDRLQDALPNLLGTGGAAETVVFGLLIVLILQRARTGIVPFLLRLLPPPPPPRTVLAGRVLPTRPQPQRGSVILSVEGATKRFGGLLAVDGVSFALRAGEILGVIGPNGAGKSTLFNLITGVLPASGGAVHIRGIRADTLRFRDIARLGVARTFQHVQLRATMSALENVALGAHGRSRKGVLAAILRLDRADEAALLSEAQRQIERVGLGKHLHDPAGNLALGQQRILEIARALAADPSLLLLDEPAAGLRHHEKQALAVILGRLRDEGVSILLVEHDMDFVMNLVDWLVVMDFGQKIAEGRPHDIQRDPAVQEAYLGAVA